MRKRKVWDEDDVYSLGDLLRTKDIAEAMLGRVFQILGIKGEELPEGHEERIWKARIVFQGSNVRTKSGTAATELYEEISNAPASFAAARCGLAVAALKGFDASLRDAESAYLQALIELPTRTPTFIELPEAWWPDSWYHDGGKRQLPKYTRPHCRLIRALYGHPEAGALWEKTLLSIMKSEGWTSLPGHGGVFLHLRTKAIMIVYVDDMLLLASKKDSRVHWSVLEKKIDFKDPAQGLARYLGARYSFSPSDGSDSVRELLTDMDNYVLAAVAKFEKDHGAKLMKVSSPYLSPEEVAKCGEFPGTFSTTCASYVATLLFLSRVARPDVATAVQRLCRVVSKWSTTHDSMLIRLFAYLKSAGPMSLAAKLGKPDLQHVQVILWSDADLCGDPEDTKSTSGMFIELCNERTGHRWPLTWAVRRQGATAGSTAEAETVALCSAVKQDGIPLCELLDFMLQRSRRPVELLCRVDNTQALAAVRRGYSKKLRYLERTQRIAIGSVHELIENGTIEAEYWNTETHRGDSFTKCLVPAKFLAARELMGMVTQ
jgi:hypothetical protein